MSQRTLLYTLVLNFLFLPVFPSNYILNFLFIYFGEKRTVALTLYTAPPTAAGLSAQQMLDGTAVTLALRWEIISATV